MKLKKPECAHCGATSKIKLYWSKRNLLKMLLKTYYCDKCASSLLPKQEHINEK